MPYGLIPSPLLEVEYINNVEVHGVPIFKRQNSAVKFADEQFAAAKLFAQKFDRQTW